MLPCNWYLLASGPVDDKAAEELRRQLAETESLIASMNMSWEEKLQKSQQVLASIMLLLSVDGFLSVALRF